MWLHIIQPLSAEGLYKKEWLVITTNQSKYKLKTQKYWLVITTSRHINNYFF